jgi:hypothetical protein
MTHTRAQAIDVLTLETTMNHHVNAAQNVDSKQYNEPVNYHHSNSNSSINSKTELAKSPENKTGGGGNSAANFYKSLGSNFNKFQRINTFLKEELAEIRHAVEDNIDYHNDKADRSSVERNEETRSVVIERQGGLGNRFVIFLLILWYMFSAFTLYTNKYIVTTQRADPTLIGTFQMFVTCCCGFLQLKTTAWAEPDHLPLSVHGADHFMNKFNKYASYLFVRNMFIIGLLR